MSRDDAAVGVRFDVCVTPHPAVVRMIDRLRARKRTLEFVMSEHRSIGTLFVVATPIGNLDDITLRAVDVLKTVAIVAAEDTRRSGVLLAHIGARPERLLSLHDHNEGGRSEQLLELLQRGHDVALISDAVWALAAAGARTWFGKSPKRIEALTATGGGLMIGLGGILLLTGNKH